MDDVDQAPDVRVPGEFEAFYRADYGAVVALTLALTGSHAVAEDLAQEAFLRVHRDWQRVRDMNSPGAWVRRIAVNLCRSRFRRLRSEAAAFMRLTTVSTTHTRPPTEYDAFWAEVRKLPLRQKQAIALFYLDDMRVAEIAEVLDVAAGTVKALLHQGRDRLERQLKAQGWANELR